MGNTSQTPVVWHQLARAVPGGIGIQVGPTLAYVSPAFASLAGADAEALCGRDWQTVVRSGEPHAAVREALTTARTDGSWRGPVEFKHGPRSQSVAVTLSALPAASDIVVWRVTAQEPPSEPVGDVVYESPAPAVSLPLARAVFDSLDDVVYVINEAGEFSYWNDQLVETTGYSHEEIQSMQPADFIPEDQQEFVPGLLEAIGDLRDRQVEVDLLTNAGERITHEFSGTTFQAPATGQVYRCGIARDITDRLERTRELVRQRDNLATLNRINDLLFETARELIHTGSRRAVEQAVCEQLATSSLYDGVWIGARALDGDGFVTREAAGSAAGRAAALRARWQPRETAVVSTALETCTVEAAHDDAPVIEMWRTATDSHDVASLVAVPFCHGETVYGILVLTTARATAFGAREQAGFEVFGRLIGVVVHAARNRELLFADTVLELEFDFTASEWPLVAAARACACRLTLDGYVPAQTGWVMYLTVEGASPSAVGTALATEADIDYVRHISGEGDTGRLEVGVPTASLLQVASDAGATVQRATVRPDTARVVCEVPIQTDSRRPVERMTDAFPGVTLVASRKCDRDITTVGRPGGLLDALTERQREVLEAAYQAGYFAWPRESTAEEVAASLGVSSATLHGHLRKAERAILAGLLDER